MAADVANPETVVPKQAQGGAIRANALLIAAVLVLAVAAALFLAQQAGEKEIGRDQFKAVLNATGKAAVVQDLRGMGEGDARFNEQNCGIQLSFTLSTLGKNVTNYAFEGDQCFGGAASYARPIADCVSEMGAESRLPFFVGFNATSNGTRFTAGAAYFYGDAQFLGDCAITGLVR
ncbi:MAG: hypothetical protein PHF51_00675 [Candidatus ainarchaeum sp.]|nr:hypothetical protein [Candidatus ainarchaeum sp.]